MSFPASGGLPPPRAQAQRGGAPLVVLWEARKAVWVPARTMSCPDSAVGEAAVLVMVVMRFLGSVEGEGLSLALVVVRTAHQCRLQMARVRVAGRKVTIGLIGGAGEMGEVGGGRVVVGTMVVGAREDLVGVAHGGVDHQVDPVWAGVTELSSFYNLLSVSHSFFRWSTLRQRETVYIQLLSYGCSPFSRPSKSRLYGNKPRRLRPPHIIRRLCLRVGNRTIKNTRLLLKTLACQGQRRERKNLGISA